MQYLYHFSIQRNKKRYAGLMWTNTEKFDYMDTKVSINKHVGSCEYLIYHYINLNSF